MGPFSGEKSENSEKVRTEVHWREGTTTERNKKQKNNEDATDRDSNDRENRAVLGNRGGCGLDEEDG